MLGLYGVKLTVSDGDGGTITSNKLVAVVNNPPLANAGPRTYVAPEFGSITLDASASSDAEQPTNTLTYLWDFDGDGAFGESGTIYGNEVGMKPTFVARADGPSVLPVALRVIDRANAMSEDHVSIRVENAAPVITSVNSSRATLETRLTDGRVNISGTYSDVGLLDTHVVMVNWGDGSAAESVSVNQSLDTFAGQHQYATGGVFAITVTAIDKDQGFSIQKKAAAYVEGVGLVDGVLYIVGTDGKDDVDIKLTGKNNDQLDVKTKLAKGSGPAQPNPVQQNLVLNAANIDRIVMLLCGSDDKAKLHKDVLIDAEMHGGDGNDKLDGGGGRDLLFGEAGNDNVSGGRNSDVVVGGDGDDNLNSGSDGGPDDEFDGRDILIGGRGKDTLKTDKGDDLLIAGFTTFDGSASSLELIRREWTSARDYTARVSNIRNGAGQFLDGSTVSLKSSGVGKTVFDDGAKDDLNGGSGRDWYFANLDSKDKNSDKLSGQKLDELIEQISG